MNLKVWSILMMVSMCMVFITPMVTMNASAFTGDGVGSVDDPYVITDVWELQSMSGDYGAHYVLGNDIDASVTSGWSSGLGFLPVGNAGGNEFTGSFDGNNYTISNLYINRPSVNDVGLFGFIEGATISNVGMVGVNVTGMGDVGGLVGDVGTSSVIINSYSVGNVSGSSSYVGGLFGRTSSALIQNCFASNNVSSSSYVGGLIGRMSSTLVQNCSAYGNVSGTSYVGGLMGYVTSGSTVINSYSVGNVSGSSSVGGLVGSIFTSYVVSCFYDTDTSGQSDDDGRGAPKSTVEMQTLSTFVDAGWDMVEMMEHNDETWYLDEGEDYPRLGWVEYDMTPIQSLFKDLLSLLPLVIILVLFMVFVGALSFKSRY